MCIRIWELKLFIARREFPSSFVHKLEAQAFRNNCDEKVSLLRDWNLYLMVVGKHSSRYSFSSPPLPLFKVFNSFLYLDVTRNSRNAIRWEGNGLRWVISLLCMWLEIFIILKSFNIDSVSLVMVSNVQLQRLYDEVFLANFLVWSKFNKIAPLYPRALYH